MTTEEHLGEDLVRLASADNFRDVAGPGGGYPTTGGGVVRRGLLFRSNELQLSDVDARSASDLGIIAIYDLRDKQEVEAHPDVEIPGASWHHVMVRGIPMDSVANLVSRDDALEVMREVYRGFVDKPGGRAAFAELLTRIAVTDGPQLFHCTAGKDRTGWAAALLLHIAGVADDVILADYLRTNDVPGTRDKYLALVREHLGEDKVAVYESVMVADRGYMQAAYDAVAASYGDRATYLREGLGLSDDILTALRTRLARRPGTQSR